MNDSLVELHKSMISEEQKIREERNAWKLSACEWEKLAKEREDRDAWKMKAEESERIAARLQKQLDEASAQLVSNISGEMVKPAALYELKAQVRAQVNGRNNARIFQALEYAKLDERLKVIEELIAHRCSTEQYEALLKRITLLERAR
jgi:hypothetical protein